MIKRSGVGRGGALANGGGGPGNRPAGGHLSGDPGRPTPCSRDPVGARSRCPRRRCIRSARCIDRGGAAVLVVGACRRLRRAAGDVAGQLATLAVPQ
jgi:hypothetical protein